MPPASMKKSPLDQKILDAGGPTPQTVLVVCGDMLRRSKHTSSARPEETERALGALSIGAAAEALAAVDVKSVRTELTRAFEESFEAAFAEDAEERTLFASSAMGGIAARDRMASALAGAKARLAIAERSQASQESCRPLSDAILSIQTAAAELDRELSSRSRTLTAVNRERRAELDKLDADQRESSWWYSSRADVGDDELVAALGDLGASSPSSRRLSAAAQKDLVATDVRGPAAEREASALRRAALDLAHPAEREWLARRAESAAKLREALDIAEDRSIESES